MPALSSDIAVALAPFAGTLRDAANPTTRLGSSTLETFTSAREARPRLLSVFVVGSASPKAHTRRAIDLKV